MTVFMYPGQGSQKPGMGQAWTEHPSWDLMYEASEVLKRDVSNLLLTASSKELTRTNNSQLATFLMSMVVLDAVTRLGAEAASHVGHSLGEYSALTAAGVIAFHDAVALVEKRGQAMQAAASEREGVMAAVIGLDDERIRIACDRSSVDVWLANYNAPGQTVIAGSPEAIRTASDIARELGAKRVIKLPVGGAFHTPFMSSAREALAQAIDSVKFQDPLGQVIANIDATEHSTGTDWPELLKAQLTSPVRWKQTLTALDIAGFDTYVELGPGKVLSGLVKRTLKNKRILSVATPEDLTGLIESLIPHSHTEDKHTSGKLTASGANVTASDIEGEHLFVTERIIVSPAAGVFTSAEDITIGDAIGVGHIIGSIDTRSPVSEVRSAFAGTLMGVLAVTGERVTTCQPIAWLRTH